MLRSFSVTILTDASGDAEDYSASRKLTGKVVGIKYDGELAALVNFTITGETSGSPIFTIIDVGAAVTFWIPRVLPHQHNDGSAFTDAAGEAPRVFNERIKIVTSDGGNADTGVLTFYMEDDTFIEAG